MRKQTMALCISRLNQCTTLSNRTWVFWTISFEFADTGKIFRYFSFNVYTRCYWPALLGINNWIDSVFSWKIHCVFKVNSKLRTLAKKKGPGAEEFSKMASSVDEYTSCLLDPLKSNMEARHVLGDSLDDLMDAGIDMKQKTVSGFVSHVQQINRR